MTRGDAVALTTCSAGHPAIGRDTGSVNGLRAVECPTCWRDRAELAEVALRKMRPHLEVLQALAHQQTRRA